MLLKSRIFITSLLLMLAACSSSPPVHYYSLSPIDTDYQQDGDDAVLLGLGPLRIPDYLNRSQLVMRDAGTEMQIDDYSHWSEPLTLAMLRVLSADVDNLLDDVVVVMFPYDSLIRDQISYRLIGDINRFDADQSGKVVLEAQWSIVTTDEKAVVPVRRIRYTAQAIATDSGSVTEPSAVVAAMNDALSQFGRDIAAKLDAALSN